MRMSDARVWRRVKAAKEWPINDHPSQAIHPTKGGKRRRTGGHGKERTGGHINTTPPQAKGINEI